MIIQSAARAAIKRCTLTGAARVEEGRDAPRLKLGTGRQQADERKQLLRGRVIGDYCIVLQQGNRRKQGGSQLGDGVLNKGCGR